MAHLVLRIKRAAGIAPPALGNFLMSEASDLLTDEVGVFLILET